MVSPRGELLFTNPAMRAPAQASTGVALNDIVAAGHPPSGGRADAADPTVDGADLGNFDKSSESVGERLIVTHAVTDPAGALVGIMVIARNLEYLGQVQSTIRYSRKLAALGRLSAGVAHEVKNPLNSMMIHLELLRQQCVPAPNARRAAAVPRTGRGRPGVAVAADTPDLDSAAALHHVDVIAGEIRRLDQVVQGFLKFTRPEDLKLQPVQLSSLIAEVVPIVQPESARAGVTLNVACDGAPDVNGDPTMLRQAFLNLALNACQAMPNGGTLEIRCERAARGRVAVSFADNGVGIKPDHLQRIFDLYFTTKPKGSGIGLSMVYRTVQMHDGEIEVQSTPGREPRSGSAAAGLRNLVT